ncbi:sortase (surface protein transpeptidase) [Streptacidiphilus sp. MAP12-33]|uniref:sortase domain-containing protein n=1 Tax=Streptacidiphilus sp. MAP12-33 TaxID=3156266 RepID=UPI0035117773
MPAVAELLVGKGRCTAGRAANGLYGWRLKAVNGRVVGVSPAQYGTEEAALAACRRLSGEEVGRHARIAHVHEGVGWVWAVTKGEGRTLARSPRAYERYATCRKALGVFLALMEGEHGRRAGGPPGRLDTHFVDGRRAARGGGRAAAAGRVAAAPAPYGRCCRLGWFGRFGRCPMSAVTTESAGESAAAGSGPAAVGEKRPEALPPPRPAPAAPAAPAPPRRSSRGRRTTLGVAYGASLLGTLLLGFGAFLFTLSAFQEEHYQSTVHRSFAYDLGQATAPTGSAPDGDPVAVLDIPAIGLRDAIVVEGTTARDLMRGPGHRRDSALPGQTGAAVLFGRRTTFGGPFAHIDALRPGDHVQVATGQGRFVYVVDGLGTGSHPYRDASTNLLVLATADASWIPTDTVLVSAHLDGTPVPNPGGRPAVVPADKALAGQPDAVAPLQLWTLTLCGAVVLTVVATFRWRRSAAWLSLTPVLLALLWAVYENAAALLPNLY